MALLLKLEKYFRTILERALFKNTASGVCRAQMALKKTSILDRIRLLSLFPVWIPMSGHNTLCVPCSCLGLLKMNGQTDSHVPIHYIYIDNL